MRNSIHLETLALAVALTMVPTLSAQRRTASDQEIEASVVRQLQDHHRARLDEVVAVVAAAEGCSTYEVAERLSWSRPWDQSRGLVRRSAIGETWAHLFHLERRGRLANTASPDDHWRVVGDNLVDITNT